MIDWDVIDTVLLDMDGTLLDLCYDNTLWNTLLPERYGAHYDLSVEAAREYLFGQMHRHAGTLSFYCLDHWAEFTGLDIVGLHEDESLAALIRYRPSAEHFLDWLRGRSKRAVLVTNAHRESLRVKDARSGVITRLDAHVSCHDYGAPKESPEFWTALMNEHPFDPERTLFIDDNHSVLNAARTFGIRHLFTVSQPDSARPLRSGLEYPAFNDFRELLPVD
ncbi:MAG: GMP/IMP nucleotidase [Gammaproteobacteria bacterium]|nr:GMP/IMP nucleotidase [Gammaproteobacteria bacterium]